MLTAIYNNGQMVANPRTAPAGSVEVHQSRTGEFEVRYLGSVLNTITDQQEANTIASLISKCLPSESREPEAA